ncbi:MAG: HlyD family efflux transporter periplasmic adaptor subunit [Candidatus Thiodiazotropha sp.]
MTVDKQLFRLDALQGQQAKWLGEVILVRPISFTLLTWFSMALASIVIAFLVWGTYTKRSTVSGLILPETGLVKVYVPQPGIVLEKHVVEGQLLKQGDVLYVLSSDRQSSTQGNTQAIISSQVKVRQQSLRDEKNKTRLLQKEERDALVKTISGLVAELEKLDSQIEGQKSRVELAEKTHSRYQGLLTKDYISKEQLQQKEEDLLDQRNRLQSLERDKISIGRELDDRQSDLNGLALKQQNLLAQIDRSIALASQELSESEAKRRLVITSPESGTATATAAEIGQAVDVSKPLVSIIPQGVMLQAQLYAPSKAIGFISPGNAVLLRYQAYPYQKFGHGGGTVMSVSKTALPSSELAPIGNMSSSGASVNTEPLYRITVHLSSQTVNAYGKPYPLQAGMLLEADVMQDTRRLYEWVLEPLYSLTGKL